MIDENCKKCGKCCEKIAVDFSQNIVFRDGIEELSQSFRDMLIPIEQKENITFCKCKFLRNKECTNPNKPEECKKYPSSPFAFLPDDCGYYGIIFIKQEHIKQQIRKLKEEILDYETQVKHDRHLQKIIDHHKNLINKYRSYGSEDW